MSGPKKLLTSAFSSALCVSALGLVLLAAVISSAAAAVVAAAVFLAVAYPLAMVKNGETASAAVSWAAAAPLAWYVLGWPAALICFALLSAYGLFYLWLLNSEASPFNKVSSAAFFGLSLLMAFIYGWGRITGESFVLRLTRLARMTGALWVSAYYDHRVPSASVEAAERHIITNIALFRENFIGWAAVAAFAGSWLVYRSVSRKAELELLPQIEDFRLPESFMWVLLGAAAVFVLQLRVPVGSFAALAASNTAVVLLAGYFAAGIALGLTLMSGLKFTPGVRWVLVISMVIFFRAAYIFVLAGILDVWFDFRRKRTEAVNGSYP